MANRAGRLTAIRGLAIFVFVFADCYSDRLQYGNAAFPANLRVNEEAEDPQVSSAEEVPLPLLWQQGRAAGDFRRSGPYEDLAAPAPALDVPPAPVCPGTQCGAVPAEGPHAWGVVGLRGYPIGQHVASNGVEFNQLFAAELNFNLWICRQHGVYLFTESTFWGQKAGAGLTNPTQGAFDFSKREFDLSAGLAWNYHGPWEARVFAYSFNNLNRGDSLVSPMGFNDGIGLENRYYLSQEYQNLGTAAYDVARASFVSLGYYPTKSMMDGQSHQFKPGVFARGYLVQNIWGPQYYLFADLDLIAARSFTPTLLNVDVGLAARPFQKVPRLEFRIGTEDLIDLHNSDREYGLYLGLRYVY